MISTILGSTLRWYQGGDWILEPVHVRADQIDYTVARGPHAGRHAVQQFVYHQVAPGIETTAWYEENGAVLHITWFLGTQTTRRFAAIPAWVAEDMTTITGDNTDPRFLAKVRDLTAQGPDRPRKIVSDQGYFQLLPSSPV